MTVDKKEKGSDKVLRIRKHGKFYSSYDNDALVLHAVTGYKISNGRVGFPENTLGKVVNKLNDYKINYVVIEKDTEVDKQKYPKDNYEKYLKIGIKNSQDDIKQKDMIERIKNLDKDKLDKIIKYLEEVCYSE